MKILNTSLNDTFRVVNKCIYCGSTSNLSDEHIIPHSLGGPWILKKASCQNCATITSKFERDIGQYFFSTIRVKLDLPTYHRKNRPTSFEFSVKRENREESVSFLAKDSPGVFMMPIFDKPGYMSNQGTSTGYKIKGMTFHGIGVEKFVKQQQLKEFKYSTQLLGLNFPRFIAKIAYGMTVLQYGLDMIEENFVVPCILGKKDDIGQWVGCENPDKSPALLPRDTDFYKISVFGKGNIVRTLIRLFACYQTPEYLVVVGKLKNN